MESGDVGCEKKSDDSERIEQLKQLFMLITTFSKVFVVLFCFI